MPLHRLSGLRQYGPLATYVPIFLAAITLLVIAYVVIDPMPGRKVVIATGLDGGVYMDFAVKYKAILKRNGIDLEIRRSAGSMQNLNGLSTQPADADIAFIQSGTSNDQVANRRGLVSLGSLFVEPAWIFYRESAVPKGNLASAVKSPPARAATSPPALAATSSPALAATSSPARAAPPSPALAAAGCGPQSDASVPIAPAITQLEQLRGMSLNVGPTGSGAPRLARQLFEINGLSAEDLRISFFPDAQATEMLQSGAIDAVFLVTAPESPVVQKLLQAPGICLMNFEQAEAYARRFSFLKHVVLPKGIVSFNHDIPRQDVQLIAPTATLVANSNTHPAIIELLMQAVNEVHGGPSWFGYAGEFPNDRYTEVPVSAIAQRYYKSGPSFLQNYLPFWWANLFERMGVVIVPLLALVIPLSRVLPMLYSWRVRSRIYRWYGQLRDVEDAFELDAAGDLPASAHFARLSSQLGVIEAQVKRLVVPLPYADELYTLKLHVERVRARMASLEQRDGAERQA